MKNSKKHFIILLAFITASLFILSGCNSKTDNLPARTPDYKEYSDSRYAEALYEITTQTDITYCTTKNYKNEDIDLKLDIYSPIGNDEQAKPAILLIHGGGLIKGDKSTDNLTKSLAMDFAKMGYVIFNVNYRLRDTASSSALKDAMTDISEAFNWIQTNCETYGVDKQRIAIGGYSSGATIAINLAYCNSSKYNIDHNSIMGVVDIAGTNLSIGSAKSNNPPCIIVHGTKDTTVSYNNAEKLKKLLTKANIENSLCPLEGANHVLTTRYDELRNRIAEFLYKQLTSKEITINTKSEISPEYLNVVQRLENNVTYEVKENVITLDGQLSEWKNTETIKLNQLKDAGESLPDANDFEGYVQFAWNEASAETLYIAAAITDNKIINNVAADGKWYHDDCLEIIFDLITISLNSF